MHINESTSESCSLSQAVCSILFHIHFEFSEINEFYQTRIFACLLALAITFSTLIRGASEVVLNCSEESISPVKLSRRFESVSLALG